jgi:hypothetical protein
MRSIRFRRLPPVAVSSTLLLLLSACANPRAEQALVARHALVGMPKQTLLSCAGVPERSATLDNIDYFTYTSRRTVAYSSPSVGFWGSRYWHPRWGYGYGLGAPFDAYDLRTYACDVTFTLRNGIVERVVYGGAVSGDSRLGQCYAIVENCLALIPPQSLPQSPAQSPAITP